MTLGDQSLCTFCHDESTEDWEQEITVASLDGLVYLEITPALLQQAIESSLSDAIRILSTPHELRQPSDLSFMLEFVESLQLPELLSGLSATTVAKVVRSLSLERIPAGKWVARQGEPVLSLRVVRTPRALLC